MFHFYILYNSTINKYYVGSTSSIDSRIIEHNKSNHRNKYTRKQKGEWVLIYKEQYDNFSDARKRESQIKGWKSRKLIERLIEQSRL